jgi:predicted PurR-regulated permease PerM
MSTSDRSRIKPGAGDEHPLGEQPGPPAGQLRRPAHDAARKPVERSRLTDGVPGWLPRAVIVALLIAVAFLLGWWLLERLRALLIMVLVAQFLAFAMEPVVNRLATRGWRRGVATGVVLFGVLAVLMGFGFGIGSLVASQVATLAERLPSYTDDLIDWTNSTFNANLSTDRIREQLTGPDGPLGNYSSRLAEDALGIGATMLGLLFQLFAVVLFAFYLCADGPQIRRGICSMLPPSSQRAVLRAWEISIDKTGSYLYSRLLLGLVSALAHYAVLQVLGVPFAVALALWIGVVSQLIPTVGTYLAAALPLLVALVTEPRDALILLIFITVYQQVENYLLQPRITARTLDMHPAVAFAAVIGGASVLGGVGALLAIPVTAIVQTFVGSYIRRYEVEEHSLTDPELDGGT